MANYYASSLAPGGGAGTKVSPFTFAEMIAFINGAGFLAGDIAWIKADGIYNVASYTITKAGTNNAVCRMEGYTTTEGDGGIATIKRAGAGATNFANHTAAYWVTKNFIFDANNLGIHGFFTSASGTNTNLECKNAPQFGAGGGATTGRWSGCKFHLNGTGGIASGKLVNCIAVNNGTYGIQTYVGGSAINCIAANNGSYGIYNDSTGGEIINCVINNNAGGGIKTDASCVTIDNNIISNNAGGYGINYTVTGESSAYNNNFWNNGNDTNIPANLINKKTVDPQFNNPAIFDFRRTGVNCNGIGLSEVGLPGGNNYEISVGIAPTKIGASILPTFAGITGLVTAAEGCLRASWSLPTNADTIEVFVQANTAVGLFSHGNMVMAVEADVTFAIIKALQSGALLDYATTYYVGAKAENGAGYDSNVVSLSLIPSDNINVAVANISLNVWNQLTSGMTTVGSIGKLLKDDIDAAISSRLATIGYTAPDNAGIAAIKADVEDVTTGLPAIKTAVLAIPTNPELATDPKLAHLDADISSRLATSSYVAPDNADIVTIKADVENVTTGLPAIKTAVNAIPTNPLLTTDTRLNNLDAPVSGVAAAVWGYTTRTLSSFGTLVADIWSYTTRTLTSGLITAADVWSYSTRSLTTFGTLVADIASAVWSAVSRTLTSPLITASDVWTYITRSLTDKINYELTSAYDSAKTAASQASVNLIPTNPLLDDDVRLDHLDADISTRASQSSLNGLIDIEGGRWKIDKTSKQMIFYKSDNTTEIMRFNLYNDTGVLDADSVYERRRV